MSDASLVVLAFQSELAAHEAHLAVRRLQSEARANLEDAVFVTRDVDGTLHVQETVDVTPADAALRSSFWGALVGTVFGGPVGTVLGAAVAAGVGALAASADDYGIPNETVRALRDAAVPGTTTLALLVSGVDGAAFAHELGHFQATLIHATLPAEQTLQLRDALAAGG